jgi:site-specific DNA recombinase
VASPGTATDGESESIRNQRSMLLDHAAGKGWEVRGIYCDEDYSGADRDRPEFRRLIMDARRGLFDVVLCKSQSRFTRDMELVEKYIHGLFPRLGIRFIALVDHADTGQRGNKKARQINGLVNEWYLEDLSENIRAVLDNKRKNGKFIGSFPVYGYVKDPQDRNRLLVDEDAAPVVRKIFSLAACGFGKQKIADFLNRAGIPNPTGYKELKGYNYVNAMARNENASWNRTTIGRILRNETYTGTMVQGKRKKLSYKSREVTDLPKSAWIRVEGTHEAIIGKDLFDRVQNILDGRIRPGSAARKPHPLAGKVRCGSCGRPMRRNTVCRKGKEFSYFRCCSCKQQSVRIDSLESLLSSRLDEICTAFFGTGWLERMAAGTGPPRDYFDSGRERMIADAEKRAAQYLRAIETLYIDRSEGRVDESTFRKLYDSLKKKKDMAKRLIKELKEGCGSGSGLQDRQCLKGRSGPTTAETAMFLADRVVISKRDPAANVQRVLVKWSF